MEKLKTMISEVNEEIKKTVKEMRNDGLKNLSAIDDLADLNAKRYYYETIVRKLQRVPSK